ncbi:MAG: hypothetical protein Q7S16_04595 [bacterium]|nr:hypothetical protein [bacterium]
MTAILDVIEGEPDDDARRKALSYAIRVRNYSELLSGERTPESEYPPTKMSPDDDVHVAFDEETFDDVHAQTEAFMAQIATNDLTFDQAVTKGFNIIQRYPGNTGARVHVLLHLLMELEDYSSKSETSTLPKKPTIDEIQKVSRKHWEILRRGKIALKKSESPIDSANIIAGTVKAIPNEQERMIIMTSLLAREIQDRSKSRGGIADLLASLNVQVIPIGRDGPLSE